jgi:hypothetical protein
LAVALAWKVIFLKYGLFISLIVTALTFIWIYIFYFLLCLLRICLYFYIFFHFNWVCVSWEN